MRTTDPHEHPPVTPEQQLVRGLTFAACGLALAYTAHLHHAAWSAGLPLPDHWRLLAWTLALVFALMLLVFGGWTAWATSRVLQGMHGPRADRRLHARRPGLQQAAVAGLASLGAALVVLYHLLG